MKCKRLLKYHWKPVLGKELRKSNKLLSTYYSSNIFLLLYLDIDIKSNKVFYFLEYYITFAIPPP